MMKGSVREMSTEEMLDETKKRMKAQCRQNIDRINAACAYDGESFNNHKDCFEASKEFLRHGSFPSCKAKKAAK